MSQNDQNKRSSDHTTTTALMQQSSALRIPSSNGRGLFHPTVVTPCSKRESPSTVVVPRNENDEAPAFPPEMGRLCRLLDLSSDGESQQVSTFLTSIGVSTLDDLEFLQESDLEASKISPVLQRKLLLLAKFLDQGGVFGENIRSMKDVLRFLKPSKKQPKQQETVVSLNVGGHCFSTSRETLCRIKDSVLAAMFSDRHPHPARILPDGSFFIDRDGTHFQHILNFLRVGAVVSLPTDIEGKEALALEADYYGLDELLRAIQAPDTVPTDFLSEDMMVIRRNEERFRDMFIQDSVVARANPHMGLESLFCPDHGQELPLKYEPYFDTESLCMDRLRTSAQPGTPVTVASLNEFHTNFNRVHENVLHRLGDILLECPVVIAGGSVLQALTGTSGIRTADWWGAKSDIDVFVHCETVQEANQIARRIFYALAVDDERWVVVRSRGVITMHRASSDHWDVGGAVVQKVQIVLRLYDSPAEVLFGFDCDCCGCCYDGRHVWVTPRCIHALRTGVNVLNPLHAWPNKASYELRLAKYAYRGFAVAIPGLDKKRIDHERIVRTSLAKLKGLARLLKIAVEMEAPPGRPWRPSPALPSQVGTLREEFERTYSADELLIHGVVGYDNLADGVIASSVYCDGMDQIDGMHWLDFFQDFLSSRVSRDEGWEEIENARSPPEGLPARLSDAWDQDKRSREYLNANLETFARDNAFYGQAYVLRED